MSHPQVGKNLNQQLIKHRAVAQDVSATNRMCKRPIFLPQPSVTKIEALLITEPRRLLKALLEMMQNDFFLG